MKYCVKNWEKYQHYKDRMPPWIKFHREILNDSVIMQLPLEHRGLLFCLWILASENNGAIPAKNEEIAWRLRVKEVDLSPLILAGLLIPSKNPVTKFESPWPSRHVSDEMRAKVMDRCNGACTACGSTENLEIDHILPISLGGTGEFNNLQVLCRSCNRSKRNRVALATQKNCDGELRSPETETETETEKKILVGQARRIIDLLNEITGRGFKHSEANLRHAKARINDGYTEDDFKAVFQHRNSEWGSDPKMREYLRPETLLGSKFDGYLQAAKAGGHKTINTPQTETPEEKAIREYQGRHPSLYDISNLVPGIKPC